MKIVSLFAGAGGMDLGFEQAGFDVVWANEFDKTIHATYLANHKGQLNKLNICILKGEDIPDCEGIIGGPPCQSWSRGGKGKGLEDERGQLFYEFIRIVSEKQPLFFVAENVPGIQDYKHLNAYNDFLKKFRKANYKIKVQILNAADFGVAQNRKRVFFVGIKNDINKSFTFPAAESKKKTLRDIIWELKDNATSEKNLNNTKGNNCSVKNHEYIDIEIPIDYRRKRICDWNEQANTIRTSGKYMHLHPTAKAHDGSERRFSVRECARIQSFPDEFTFEYMAIKDGYKMVGNAVPVKLAFVIANEISRSLLKKTNKCSQNVDGLK